jgi:hypothetical protein
MIEDIIKFFKSCFGGCLKHCRCKSKCVDSCACDYNNDEPQKQIIKNQSLKENIEKK